jgi:urease accessory protein
MDTIDRVLNASDGAARLLTWLSPAFPIGSFSYSHGLEYAVEAGLVTDRATLTAWIEGVLRYGGGRLDGMLLLAAHRAATASDTEGLREVAALASAMRGSAELALESNAQGAAF